MARPKAIYLARDLGERMARTRDTFSRVYGPEQRREIESLATVHADLLMPNDLHRPALTAHLAETEFIFSTWGMPLLSEADLAKLPRLRVVFYGAGTVRGFAEPLLARRITVVSAWAANAVPVAEFTVAQILLALKSAHRLSRATQQLGLAAYPPSGVRGAYGAKVALISLGMIGRRVLEHLRPFDLRILACEPFAKTEFAGVKLISLEECFEQADVVSLHAPNLPSTRGMIQRRHFESMPHGATFINTARGEIVDQEAMLEVLAARPDLTAIIDVTDPHEPPAAGSPFYSLPNLFLTPHIAGSAGNELARMGQHMVEELRRLLTGEPLRYAVTEEMLGTMA